MNQETRRLSKIPEQVREEVVPFYLHRLAIATEKNDHEKIDKLTDKTAERIRSGLAVSIINQFFFFFFFYQHSALNYVLI
jgi:hypothetical protein